MDLHGGEADPPVLVHGRHHVVDKALEIRLGDLRRGDFRGGRSQDRIAQARYLENGHAGFLAQCFPVLQDAVVQSSPTV